MTRNLFLALLFAAVLPLSVFADQYGGFQQFSDAGSLKPFARDLGGILGSGTFHGARTLGVTGWDVSFRGGMQFSPDKNDKIMRDNGIKGFGLPLVQAEVGMPLRLDGFIRGMTFEGLTVAGGGIRYGLIKGTDKPWSPKVMLVGVGHAVVHQHFSANHIGVNLVFSAGINRFAPYIGGGFDRTRLTARSSTRDPAIAGNSVTTFEYRGTVGVRVKPFKRDYFEFIYLAVAYNFMHGKSGSEASFGIRF